MPPTITAKVYEDEILKQEWKKDTLKKGTGLKWFCFTSKIWAQMWEKNLVIS